MTGRNCKRLTISGHMKKKTSFCNIKYSPELSFLPRLRVIIGIALHFLLLFKQLTRRNLTIKTVKNCYKSTTITYNTFSALTAAFGGNYATYLLLFVTIPSIYMMPQRIRYIVADHLYKKKKHVYDKLKEDGLNPE